MQSALNPARDAARTLSVELQMVEVRRKEDWANAFAALKARRSQAVVVVSDPMFGNDLDELAWLAAAHRLPAIYNRAEFAKAGGLLAFGPNYVDNYRRVASYVDKILKGAKPADMPVEQPAKFDLVVNQKTAKALGLTIPVSVLGRATEVIE